MFRVRKRRSRKADPKGSTSAEARSVTELTPVTAPTPVTEEKAPATAADAAIAAEPATAPPLVSTSSTSAAPPIVTAVIVESPSRTPSGRKQPAARRALRREAIIRCLVQNARSGSLREATVYDLSPDGMRLGLRSDVQVGDELLLSFRPPRWQRREELLARADVVRVTLGDGGERDIAVRYIAMPAALRTQLSAALIGVPPPLPRWVPADDLVEPL
jgi:hypothetical protein